MLAEEDLVLFGIHEVEPDVVYLVLLEHILVVAYLHAVAVPKGLFRQPRQVRTVGQHNAERGLALLLCALLLAATGHTRHNRQTRGHVADVYVSSIAMHKTKMLAHVCARKQGAQRKQGAHDVTSILCMQARLRRARVRRKRVGRSPLV